MLGEKQDNPQEVAENITEATPGGVLATDDTADEDQLKEAVKMSDAKPTITAKSATAKAKTTAVKASSTKAGTTKTAAAKKVTSAKPKSTTPRQNLQQPSQQNLLKKLKKIAQKLNNKRV